MELNNEINIQETINFLDYFLNHLNRNRIINNRFNLKVMKWWNNKANRKFYFNQYFQMIINYFNNEYGEDNWDEELVYFKMVLELYRYLHPHQDYMYNQGFYK